MAIEIIRPNDSEISSAACAAFAMEADAWLHTEGASCALWWKQVPPHKQGPIGCIGAWDASDRTAAAEILNSAVHELASHGAKLVVGPLNGNTWRKYRLVVESDGRPPFFLEPNNPNEWVSDFVSAGFEPFSCYSSGAVDLTLPGPDLSAIRRKLEAKGVIFTPIDVYNFEQELRDIHALSLQAFSRNVLYTPLDWENFQAMYMAIRPRLVPELAWMARDAEGLAAYLFGLPDFLDVTGKTAILKTLAARSEARYAGIGSVLTAIVQEEAKKLGFTTAIHALQYEHNTVHRLSDRFGSKIFRRYALFAKSP